MIAGAYLDVPRASKATAHKEACGGSDTDRTWADCHIAPCSVYKTQPKAEIRTRLPPGRSCDCGHHPAHLEGGR